MAAPRSKKTTTKKAPTKRKRATKKAHPKSPEPIDLAIEGELRYKLKAAQLAWEAAENRVVGALQPEIQRLLQRARRNDREWKRLQEERIEAFNEVIEAMTPDLPEGFAIKNLDAAEGTIRALHDPSARGDHVGG